MKRKHNLIIIGMALILTAVIAQAMQTASAATSAPVLDRMVKKGEMVLGTAGSMPPLNLTTRDGQIAGMEIDIARKMAAVMGVKLRIKTMPFHELLPALEAGRVDIVMSGMTITGKRNLKFAFVGPYFISGKSVLTKLKTMASIESTAQLNSPRTTLAALKGSTSQLFVESKAPKAKLITTKNYNEAIDLVLAEKVDALVADYTICAVSVFRYPDQQLTTLTKPMTYEPIGIAVTANDPLLVNWIENFLTAMKGSGELEGLQNRWIKNASWLKLLPPR